MTDGPVVELRAPLPGNALEARLTWRRERGGLRGDQDVPRAEATHATLWVKALDGKDHERRLTLEEADSYLGEVRAGHERIARLDAETVLRRSAEAERRAEATARIRLACPYCDVPRTYAGRHDLLSAGAPEHVARAEQFQLARPQATGYHEYVCPSCGSVELFRAGTLEHPLPGTAPD